MAEKKIKWTRQQRKAIGARGSDVLVTASAGTGKTSVLSGRCADIVSDRAICPDVLSILVLTFTDAAAEQMRLRIAEQLKDAFLKTGSSHLRYQLMLLAGADISTIHSFCKRLITEYFYKLGLDPTFRVIDSDEAKLLKSQAIEKTIEWAWQQDNLRLGFEQLLYRRDLRTTDGFVSKIEALSGFLDSVVWRDKWYERAAMLAQAIDPSTCDLGEKQKQIVAEKLGAVVQQVQYAQKLYENETAGGSWSAKWQEIFVEPVSKCIKFLEAGDWDNCLKGIRDFQRPTRFEYKPRGLEGPVADVISRTAKSVIKAFDGLGELAVMNPDYLDRVGGAVGLQTKIVIELTKRFDRFYSQAKRAINGLDFADLEHYALELLADEESSGDKPVPSETALALRRKYKYIFVDEYQDINPVQQTILEMLSCEGNVFVVGDVKQSIYAFRGAEPKIFIDELKQASVEPGKSSMGLRVDLNANWRSEKGILDFVNKIFGRIMTAPFAGVDYNESARLKPASEDGSKGEDGPVVELHILDEAGVNANEQNGEFADEQDTNIINARQHQAAMIAQRIRKMVGADTGKAQFQIYDKKLQAERDVRYGDIVILMRSLAKRANDYVEILRLANVPVKCAAATGYFEATEISDCLCLLKVLDNPQRDIEFAAVLRSPFFNVGDTELAKIKIHSRSQVERSYYDCVVKYSDSGPDAAMAAKLKKLLDTIERWRILARRGDLADLIWRIYRESRYLSFISALPNGRQRKANLLKLHDRAIQFGRFAGTGGGVSLRRFVEFIEKLQETGQDWAGTSPEMDAENAVRIISVHKAKGLEFGVVFLAELDSRFNTRDIQDDFLAEADDTLGLQIIDRQSNTKLSSLAHQVIAEEKRATLLAEEMRILYVAMTRARERLILTSCEKARHCRDVLTDGFFFGDSPIDAWKLRQCRSHFDWVLYGLSDQRDLHNSFKTDLAKDCGGEGLFDLNLYDRAELQQLSDFVLKLKNKKPAKTVRTTGKQKPRKTESKLFREIKTALNWRYGFGEVFKLPAKRSVTELTHRTDEYVKIDYSGVLQRLPKAVLPADLTEKVDARLIGTATHLVIAHLDLAKAVNEQAIEKTKEELLSDGAITEAAAGCIDTGSIMSFFESHLGQMVLDGRNSVCREWPFTFSVQACELANSSHELRVASDEFIVVQGIVDMLVERPDGLVIIDFKTDNVTGREVQERAESYRQQLELYGRAAEAILKKPVESKWLYFLTLATEFEIK